MSTDDRTLLIRLVKTTGGVGPCPEPVPPRLSFEELELPDGQSLVAYLPADAAAEAALDRLAGRARCAR